ncbi:ATP-dependent DNA helicase [Xylanibacter oryzae]|uniref:ATP-dependent DNA helicase n=1 Tax=Xylanibacter oryzae TaxID=185293 RepID=UPI0004B995EE|nr:AAA family ATPase [Xylanibacter oryzae]
MISNSNVDLDNKELQKALQLIQFTRRSLFLTGKAGTGKSTFLRYICSVTKKKYVVLAPTGIAAINAGGSTLHSFFKIPFFPLLPNDSRYSVRHIKETLKYNGTQRRLLREVELIIIDEISMVRADIIDFVDKVLRIYSHNMREPFGGKQLLLVGDIYQLEPVIKEEDRKLLRPFYTSCFFFDANVFKDMQLVSIELKKVYRQSDASFVDILNRIRNSTTTTDDIIKLNQRLNTELPTKDNDLVITLATRRDTVDYINDKKLDELPGTATTFTGEIRGEFPQNSLPNPIELKVKVGAQIIFIKNDMDKRWVNGTLGVIEAIDEKEKIIYVVTEDGNEYEVQRESWRNLRYTFNDTEKKIEEEELGVYIQYPIRLAWAITIHKSQGLTFRQVQIDFTGGVFAGGQAYVALSRCTSLDGISLKDPIRRDEIFVRNEIINFAKHYNDNSIINKAIKESKADKEYHDAIKAFEVGDMDKFLNDFFKAIHSRYDIEKPAAKRLIRRKLNCINSLKEQNCKLIEEKKRQDKFLMRLAAEFTLLGKECEKEHMNGAAISNYKKAIELYPNAKDAIRRLKKLEDNVS